MDIMAKINEIVDKIKKDPDLLKKFKTEPVKVIESLIGVDLPDDQITALVEGVKTKIDLDNLGDIGDLLGGLFGKK